VDVLTLIMQGKSNKAICRVLDLSEPIVKSHISTILCALKVNRKRPRDGDLPEAPSPAVPPSPTRSPQGAAKIAGVSHRRIESLGARRAR